MIDTAKSHKGLAAVVLTGAVLLGGGVSATVNGLSRHTDSVSERAAQQSEAIHASQVNACEASLEPGGVRYIIAQQIQQQIARAKRVDYHKFFPNIPPGQLHTLIHKQRADQYQEIHDLTAVNCQAQFPKP